MSGTDLKDVRNWSGPIKELADDERRVLVDSMSAGPMPRIAITEALRNNWFEIWYQPKIDLKRKCLAAAEALARIRHPQAGVLLPGSFLPDVDENAHRRTRSACVAGDACRLGDFRGGGL